MAARKEHPSSLQISVQAVGKPIFQLIEFVLELFSGGVHGKSWTEAALPPRDLFGQVVLKRRFGRAFLVDAKRSGAWKSLVAHLFRLGGSEDRRLLVSRSGWVAEANVLRVRKFLCWVIYDIQTESPNGFSFVSLVVSESVGDGDSR